MDGDFIFTMKSWTLTDCLITLQHNTFISGFEVYCKLIPSWHPCHPGSLCSCSWPSQRTPKNNVEQKHALLHTDPKQHIPFPFLVCQINILKLFLPVFIFTKPIFKNFDCLLLHKVVFGDHMSALTVNIVKSLTIF